MLASGETIKVVAESLRYHNASKIVIDPVCAGAKPLLIAHLNKHV